MTLGKRPALMAIEGSDHHQISPSSPSSSSKENYRRSHHQSGSLDRVGDSSSKATAGPRGGAVNESSSLPWIGDRDTPDDTPDDSPHLTYDDGTGSGNHGGSDLRSLSLQRRDHDRNRRTSFSSDPHHLRRRRQGLGRRGQGLDPGSRSESLGESEGDFDSSTGRGGRRRHDRDHHDDDDDCDSDVYVAPSDALGQAVLNTASAMFRGNLRHDGSHGLDHRRHLDGHRRHDGTSGTMTMIE